jgi:hypothetical protein
MGDKGMDIVDHWTEIVEFLVAGPTPEQIAAFEGSEDFQERVRYLRDQNRNGLLTDSERQEMDDIAATGRFMRRLKIRSLEKIAENQLPVEAVPQA